MKKIAIACALAFCATAGIALADEKPACPEEQKAKAEASAEEAKIKKAAVDFCNAMVRDGDIDAAKKLMSKDAAKLFDMLAALGGEDAMKQMREEAKAQAKKDAKFTAGKVTITGDKAKVTVKGKIGNEAKDEDETLDMVKEDGQWKIAIDKEGMGDK